MPKVERKLIYKNPNLSVQSEINEIDADNYRIVLGCGYRPIQWKKAVGNNPDNNPKHNLETVPRR